MTKIKIISIAITIILALVIITGCIDSGDQDNKPGKTDDGYTSFNNDSMKEYIDSLPNETLSTDEETGLLFMREEEKLAHDVYSTLYNKWGKNIFTNIADSEETHTQSIALLIEKYNLTDPFINEVGTFQNDTLQQLYTDLVETGSLSLVDALKVGAMIEEIDIIDIQEYVDMADNEDIIFVYENLMMGSRNHLRSFVKTLDNEGVTYSPSYLSQQAYDDIIDSDMETNQYRV